MHKSRLDRRASTPRSRGVTLIEACTVVAIAAIVATAALPTMGTVIETRRLDGMATQLAADVHYARTEAVARHQAVRLSVHSGCYIVHTGATRDCQCVAEQARCSGDAQALKAIAWGPHDTVRVQANVASLAFDPVLGTASPAGTLRITGRSERAVTHVVNLMGRLRSCSPQAQVPGYRAC